MSARGFTLIEALIGLALSVFLIAAGLEFFAAAQRSFRRLKGREEAGQAALAALDRIRIDLLHSGRGLVPEIELGLVEPVAANASELRLTSLERPLELRAEALAGETRIALAATADITAGQLVSLRQGAQAELRTVVRVEPGAVLVEPPLGRSYSPAAAARLSLLELVTYSRDGASRVLRRRVNSSPAQPLLEDAAGAAWVLDPASPLVRVRLEVEAEGVHRYDATVFLKNPALAR